MVFRWVFIPWLQMELNAYKDRVNNTAKRCDRNKVCRSMFTSRHFNDASSKVLPHGIPDMIYNSPEDFGALDFKVRLRLAWHWTALNNLLCADQHRVRCH